MTDAPVSQEVLGLLRRAHNGLAEAASPEQSPAGRFVAAHLAALRAAAAVVSAKPMPGLRSRRQPRAVWEILPLVVPELSDWAAYFAGNARKRAHAEAGFPTAVTAAEADEHLKRAEDFLTVVEQTLDVKVQPALPLRVVSD